MSLNVRSVTIVHQCAVVYIALEGAVKPGAEPRAFEKRPAVKFGLICLASEGVSLPSFCE